MIAIFLDIPFLDGTSSRIGSEGRKKNYWPRPLAEQSRLPRVLLLVAVMWMKKIRGWSISWLPTVLSSGSIRSLFSAP